MLGRNLAKSEVLELLKCDWIDRGQHVLLTGSSRTGKTWISCAFGVAAVQKEKTVRYLRVFQLVEEIQYAQLDGSLRAYQKSLKYLNFLILDDFALHPFSKQERADSFEVIEARSSASSLIIVGQRRIKDWYSYIKDRCLPKHFSVQLPQIGRWGADRAARAIETPTEIRDFVIPPIQCCRI